MARTAEEEAALLAERLPLQLVQAWGLPVCDSIRKQGLHTRTRLLTLMISQIARLVLPEPVVAAIRYYWGFAWKGALFASRIRPGRGVLIIAFTCSAQVDARQARQCSGQSLVLLASKGLCGRSRAGRGSSPACRLAREMALAGQAGALCQGV